LTMKFLNFKSPINSGRKSVFMRIDPGANGAFNHINGAFNHKTVSLFQAGVLGPVPNPKRLAPGSGPLLRLCSNCLSPAHDWPACTFNTRCRRCLCFGHVSGACRLLPQSSRCDPSNSRVLCPSETLVGGPLRKAAPQIFHSITEYIKELSGISSIPTPITVPWRRPWRLRAPEFDNSNDGELAAATTATTPAILIICSSLSEFGSKPFGISHLHATIHVAWTLKPPTSATVPITSNDINIC
jgi:hypothetical protein